MALAPLAEKPRRLNRTQCDGIDRQEKEEQEVIKRNGMIGANFAASAAAELALHWSNNNPLTLTPSLPLLLLHSHLHPLHLFLYLSLS